LAAFITARLDEDEVAAKLAASRPLGPAWDDGTRLTAVAAHINRHDPARVLRDIAFGRWILEEHSPEPGLLTRQLCRACWGRVRINGMPAGPGHYPCQTLRRYAARWSTHSGYPVDCAPEDEARA
jgi:hypothetical protein